MMLFKTVLAVLLGSGFAPGVHAASPAPLIVVLGGFGSCVSDSRGGFSPFAGSFTKEGVRMVNELYAEFSAPDGITHGMKGGGFRWLFSCFTKGSKLYFQGSADAGVMTATDSSALTSRIDRLSEGYQRPIYFIGHSHGGWLAMRLIESLPKPLVAGYLATLDPISMAECHAGIYADAFLMIGTGWPASAWNRIAPCRRAPDDFTAGDILRIRERLAGNVWKHYYQTHFVPLHSGAIIDGPDSSLDMTPFFNILAGGAARSWNAHTRLSNLSSIWFALKASIVNDYENAGD